MKIESKITRYVLLLSCLGLLGACTETKVYYFLCTEQTPSVIDTYISVAFKNIDYEMKKDTLPHSYIGIKYTKVENTKNGVLSEGVRMYVKFNFDSTRSEIRQYYFTQINGNTMVKPLNMEQRKLYEPDVALFQEKMLFYCNPLFKGR